MEVRVVSESWEVVRFLSSHTHVRAHGKPSSVRGPRKIEFILVYFSMYNKFVASIRQSLVYRVPLLLLLLFLL